jgi:hypothetical protein
MRLDVVARLAWPRTTADRVRSGLIAGSTGIVGAFLIAGARVARLGAVPAPGATFVAGGRMASEHPAGSYSFYLAEEGLRAGYLLALVLMTVPFAALAVQALRLGTTRRERWMSALRLAGGTPAEVRRIAAAECAIAACAGGVLALPSYGLLWILLDRLTPTTGRLLPPPDVLDLAAWAGVIALSVAAGALAGWVVHRRVVDDPLSGSRHGTAGGPGAGSLAVLAGGLLTAVVSFALATSASSALGLAALGAPVGLVCAALAAGPWVVRLSGRLLVRSGRPLALLAGRRMVTDPRTGGRAAGVLVVCGMVIGVVDVLATGLLRRHPDAHDIDFHLTGLALAAAAAGVAALVAVFSLVVGATDDLLTHRRSIASLRVLGLEPRHVRRVQRRQLSAPAVCATATGILAGTAAMWTVESSFAEAMARRWTVLVTVGALAGCALAVWVVVLLAARLLTGSLREAMDPENLRAS